VSPAELLAGLPDEALVPVGWLRNQLDTSDATHTALEDMNELSLAEWAELNDCARSTARQWCADKLLPGAYKRRGRKWRIPRSAQLPEAGIASNSPQAATDERPSRGKRKKLSDWRKT